MHFARKRNEAKALELGIQIRPNLFLFVCKAKYVKKSTLKNSLAQSRVYSCLIVYNICLQSWWSKKISSRVVFMLVLVNVVTDHSGGNALTTTVELPSSG